MAAIESPVSELVCRCVPLDWRRAFGGDEDAACALWQVRPQEPVEREKGEPQVEAFNQTEHVHLARLIHACLVQQPVRRACSHESACMSRRHGLLRLFSSGGPGPSRSGEELSKAQDLLLVLVRQRLGRPIQGSIHVDLSTLFP